MMLFQTFFSKLSLTPAHFKTHGTASLLLVLVVTSRAVVHRTSFHAFACEYSFLYTVTEIEDVSNKNKQIVVELLKHK